MTGKRAPARPSQERASTLDAGAHWPQQKRRKMRVICGLGCRFAGGLRCFGAADGWRAGSRRSNRRDERGNRGLRLRAGIAVATGAPGSAFAARLAGLLGAVPRAFA